MTTTQLPPEDRRLAHVDLSGLASADVDPTRYVIAGALPRRHVTLLGAHGGAGKSVLALTLAAHVAAGRPFAGLAVEAGRVLFLSLEDPGNLTRYRLRRIADDYALPIERLKNRITLLDGSSADAALAIEVTASGTRGLAFTSTLAELEDELEAAEAALRDYTLLAIDNATDAFSANENDRRLVNAFIRHLAGLAQVHDCAVLLLAHIDKAAARHGAAGNAYSGSTAWHNTSRSRFALTEPEGGGIQLIHEKFNLGRKLDPIALEWSASGVLVPREATGSQRVERDTLDDAAVLAAVEAVVRDGGTVYAARSGSHTAMSVLRTYPELPEAMRRDTGRFWLAVTRLERTGRLIREAFKTPTRKDRERFVPVQTGQWCAEAPNARQMGSEAFGALAPPSAPNALGGMGEVIGAEDRRTPEGGTGLASEAPAHSAHAATGEEPGPEGPICPGQVGHLGRLYRRADRPANGGGWEIATVPADLGPEEVRQRLEAKLGVAVEVKPWS